MSDALVWAFQPLKELNGETGFVVCDEKLAAALIAADKVQDPREGGFALREINQAPAADYETKVLTARKRKSSDAE